LICIGRLPHTQWIEYFKIAALPELLATYPLKQKEVTKCLKHPYENRYGVSIQIILSKNLYSVQIYTTDRKFLRETQQYKLREGKWLGLGLDCLIGDKISRKDLDALFKFIESRKCQLLIYTSPLSAKTNDGDVTIIYALIGQMESVKLRDFWTNVKARPPSIDVIFDEEGMQFYLKIIPI